MPSLDRMAKWFLGNLVCISLVEAVSAVVILPNFTTAMLSWFFLGLAEQSLVAVQAEDAYLCKAFA